MDPRLQLHEAVARPKGPVQADGTVQLYVIRPGIGRGKGKHLYEADMLAENAHVFNGWKMFVDHQSASAKKAQEGLPRSVRDLGGIVKEAWWDPTVPAANGHGAGAVVANVKPTRLIRSLIEDDPELVEASISATATGVRPVTREGQTVWLVEGIGPRGSVDWVTEAGAGGKVAGLMESLEEADWEAEADEFLRELLPDDEIAVLARGRAVAPELYAQLVEAAKADELDEGDGGAELEKLVQKHLPKFKGNRKLAERAARREYQTAREAADDEGGDVGLTEALHEALSTDEGKRELGEALAPVISEVFGEIVAPRLAELVEAALEDERELMQAESNAIAERKLQLRDMRDGAHEQIAESKLPEAFQVELRKKYDLVNGAPTADLDVADDFDDDGKVTKTAEEKLRESVASSIETQRGLFESAAPKNRVSDQGARRTARPAAGETPPEGDNPDGGGGGEGGGSGDEGRKAGTTGSPLTDKLLTESRVPAEELGNIYELQG